MSNLVKVFCFSKEGHQYYVKSSSRKNASQYLLECYDMDIKNCIEVPEEKWDEPTVLEYPENDFDQEPVRRSFRDGFSNRETELLSTTDVSIFS